MAPTRLPGWPHDLKPRWARSFPVLGIEAVVEATDACVAPAIERAFGAWADVAEPLRTDQTVRFRLIVIDSKDVPAGRVPVQYRVEGARALHAVTDGGTGYADAERGQAWARVSRALVEDVEHFRYGIVEALTYFLLSHLDRQPFHCAAVARSEHVVLLAGPPGTGKSTLAFLALKAGFTVMAEDMVWVQQRPAFRVWGLTPVIHLPGDAREEFPELAAAPTLLANGQPKVVVAVNHGSRPSLPSAEHGAVCVLARGAGAARLERIDRAEVEHTLQETLQSGFDRFPTTIPAVVEAWAPEGGWRLWLGERPRDTVPCLEELVATLGG